MRDLLDPGLDGSGQVPVFEGGVVGNGRFVGRSCLVVSVQGNEGAGAKNQAFGVCIARKSKGAFSLPRGEASAGGDLTLSGIREELRLPVLDLVKRGFIILATEKRLDHDHQQGGVFRGGATRLDQRFQRGVVHGAESCTTRIMGATTSEMIRAAYTMKRRSRVSIRGTGRRLGWNPSTIADSVQTVSNTDATNPNILPLNP